MIALAESIVAHPRYYDSTSHQYLPRLPYGLDLRLFRMGHTGVGQLPIFDWWIQPYDLWPGVTTPTVRTGFSYCYDAFADGLVGNGGEMPIEQFRMVLASVKRAVAWAEELRRGVPPTPLRADIIDSRDAACEARPRTHPLPRYPYRSGDALGDVHIDAIVDTSGRLEPASVRVLFATDSVFTNEALRTIDRWRFAPALLTLDTPVRQRLHLQVHFSASGVSRDEIKDLLIDAGDHGANMLVISQPRPEERTRTSSRISMRTS
jgi:TonB family protein